MNESVSIAAVLCNYNGGPYLKEAIDSVLSQEYMPSEFIIVDDCSTDNSVDIVNVARQKYPELITLVQHNENKGQAAGMNTAFNASSSDLIAFLDSDDLWFPKKLAALRDAYLANPGFGLYQHNLQILLDTVMTDECYSPAMSEGDVFELWRLKGIFPLFSPTAGLAIRREILQKISPLPSELTISSDSFLTRSAICFGPLVSSLTPLGAYRRHSSNNVFGNDSHNAVKYFHHVVCPLLAKFYELNGFAPPEVVRYFKSQRQILNILLDVNLRAIIKILRRLK